MQMFFLWAFFTVLAAFGVLRGLGALQRDGVAGIRSRTSRSTRVLAAVVIAIAWGLFAATQLGFIPNHAP